MMTRWISIGRKVDQYAAQLELARCGKSIDASKIPVIIMIEIGAKQVALVKQSYGHANPQIIL
ncbi:hypothetical protein X749_30500 [Mesorhizobium sp. LNJC391B00]|nr:hypothetical protein X749_30500 [Mesorhizobium sp. LNJC391B00]